ncbi:MAG TPA: GAF domain-containing protein [Syntrophorhabdaceae bacterium]|jgi:signal transduction protein with GAF and PtsI domain
MTLKVKKEKETDMMTEELKERLQQKEQELKILHEIAQDISSNLSLHELLEKIVDMVMNTIVADSCLIYLYDKGNDELTLTASSNEDHKMLGMVKLKLGEGVTGWVAKEKKPLALASKAYKDQRFKTFAALDDEKYEAFLSIPILSKNEIAGVMNIRNREEHAYPSHQIDLLFTVSRYLGSAISHARTYDEVVSKARQLDLLSEVSRTIVSDYYLKEILQLIVTMTAKVMDSKICSIMLLDEKREELVIAATQSLSQDYVNKPNLKVGQSVSGRIVLEKKPITVLDVTKEKGFMYPDVAKKEGIVSLLSVPMMIKDRVIGVINSYTKSEHSFRKEEIDILQAVANQAAVAIENTHLSQEIFAAREALEARKTIERAKGILMKELGVTEDEAYKKIHKKSMDLRKTMKEIAEAIILTSDLKRKL